MSEFVHVSLAAGDPIGTVIVFLVIFAAAYVFIFKPPWINKRRNGLIDLAGRLHLHFDESQNHAVAGQYAFLKDLYKGDNRYATNILSGTYLKNQVLAFDYHYETCSMDARGRGQTQHYWFSFFILTLPAVFPALTIRRDGFLTKIAESFGYQDIKFESAEFSKHFCVRSADKKFAYDVCNAPMIEYLVANRDLSIEIEKQVLALAFNKCLSVGQIEKDLQRLVEIRARFPQYLIANA